MILNIPLNTMKTNPLLLWALAAITLHAASLSNAAETYLVVGAGGQRMFASDGLAWEKHISWGIPGHDQNDLNVATFFKGAAFVGGGYSTARLTATRDGVTWSEGALPGGGPVFGLEPLGDTLYAVTIRGFIYKTTDGENFTPVGEAQMPTKTHWIRSTAAGNGIIVGSGDFGPALAFDPKTGKITITQMAGQTEKKATLRRVAFGGGMFVVGGQDGLLAASKDGVTWQNNEAHPERGDIASVVWTGKQFVASSANGTLVSSDGVTWQTSAEKVPRVLQRAGAWIYGWSWPPYQIQRSKDGLRWEPVPNEKKHGAHNIAFGDLAGTGAPPKLPQKK
jgi:hypothetical protein